MIARACLNPETIGRYVAGTLDPAEAAEAGRHMSGCVRCRERTDLVRRVATAGSDRVAASVEDIAARVERLLAEPSHRWELLAPEPLYRDPAVARRLLAVAVDERDRDPRRAAAMAHAAGVIGQLLAGEARSAFQVRFDAWSLEAALLREAGRYSACGAALVRAEDAADDADNAELAHAIVSFGRALLCSEPDIWHSEEALALLDRAEEVFARLDPERRVRAVTLRGMVLLRSGDADAASVAFEQVLDATSRDDAVAYADAATNLAAACIAKGAWNRADRLLGVAEKIDRRCKCEVGLACTLLHRARLERGLGRHEAAVRAARTAMRAFEKLAMGEESVRSGLVAVYPLVALARLDAATKLCALIAERSIALDLAEPSRRRALTAEALAYLRELARRRALSVDVVSSVEIYVEKIAISRPTPFTPPYPLQTM